MPSIDEAVAAADRLAGKVDILIGVVDELKTEQARSNAEARRNTEQQQRRIRLQSAVLAVLAFLVFGFGYLALSNRATSHAVAQQAAIAKAQAACLRTYNNEQAARTSVLTQPSIDQQLALADAFRSLLPFGKPKTPAQIAATEQKFVIYLQKADAYQHLVQANPPPLAPRYAC